MNSQRSLQHFILTRFNLLLWNKDKEGGMGEKCHFIIDGIEGVEPFMSEQHVEDFAKATLITITYQCGDAKLEVKYE